VVHPDIVSARRVLHPAAILLCAAFLGCNTRKDDVVIVSSTLKQQSYTDTGAPSEFGGSAGLSGTTYYVEGQVRNKGTRDITHLDISFPCKAGVEKKVLTAEIPRLPAGATVDFRTKPYQSRVPVTLREDAEPEISMDR
jgi:hypothetical protein